MISTIRGSQIIDIFESNSESPTVANWMFNHCNRKDGPKFRQRFVESLDFRYKLEPDRYFDAEYEKLCHMFKVECEHGWLSQKEFPDIILSNARFPDMPIAYQLENAIDSIHKQCDLCRSR